MFEIIARAEAQRAFLEFMNNANDESVTVAGIFVADDKDGAGPEKRVLTTPVMLKKGENKRLEITASVLDALKPTRRLEERKVKMRVDVEPEVFSGLYDITAVVFQSTKILWFGIEDVAR